MRKALVMSTGAALAILAAVPAPAEVVVATPTLAQRLAQTASGFCVDIVSKRVPVPTAASPAYAKYGLTEGMPNAAMTALGREGGSLVSRATLASGTASDGDFVVALGGAAGETCRLIVYRADVAGAVERDTLQIMALGWRSIPTPASSPVVRMHRLFKRDVAKLPYLANVIAPISASAVSLVIIVSAIPPSVTLPSGY